VRNRKQSAGHEALDAGVGQAPAIRALHDRDCRRLAITLGATMVTLRRDDSDAERQFSVLAENHFMVLQNGVNEYVNRLKAVRALFDSSADAVTRSEFDAFTRPLIQENAAIATLSWVPRITREDRATHERQAASEGLRDYQIKAITQTGKLVASPERDEYFPIFYGTVSKTSPLYGLDLGSEKRTLAELEQARDGNRLSFSPVPRLVSAGGAQPGFLFSLPIYDQGLDPDTVAARRRELVGFVHGSVITATMVSTIINNNKTPKGLDLFFYLPASGEDVMPFVMHPSRLRTSPLAPLTLAAAASDDFWRRDLKADGKSWLTVVARPMPDGPLVARHGRSWVVLAFGLILTAAVVIYVRSSRSHAFRIMRINQKVSDLAQKDALTSLANRRAFVERLRAAFAACRRGAAPFSVIYFDLDHFKDVNDTLGHAVGDELLRQVAARVRNAVRETDVIARFGGDEFAILQSDVVEHAAAGALAAKIGQLIAQPFMIEGNEVHVSASIGIARYGADVARPDEMMIQADLALYRAKEDGRNCYRFHSDDLDRQVQERVIIAEELRGAVDRNELELHYQPQVELRSGRIVGLEALLRWNHGKHGQISPSVFIPIAERSGQIQMLGQWVLDAACRQLRAWQDAGFAPELVGVNFSALHFKASGEIDREVGASLDKWGIRPAMIEIELTESVLMDITQQHDERFRRLRQLGVRIAIDDFGTGYSSLSYLANYPINRMKIAQELVSGADTDARNAAVVRAAIRLAHELDIEIVAEGVETEGQERFLLSAGCEFAQGYFFSKPVNAARATELLRAGKITPARRPLRLVEGTAA
jgi:diguanylate cyclase (GGDEF)-like protein